MENAELGVMLYVSDLNESVEFYRDKLGCGFKGYWDNATNQVYQDWEEAEEPGYAAVEVGDAQIGLHPDSNFEAGESRFLLQWTVDDARGLHEEYVARGVEAPEPEKFPWGEIMFTVTDPDGHEITIKEEID